MMLYPDQCACCSGLLSGRFDRRAFLAGAGAAGIVTAFPLSAFAATGNYEAMVLCCIDPRFPALTLDYMKGRGMLGQYSQFAIAGAAIGVVAPAFKDWHKAFWDNLAASMQLHQIKKVIAIDHRDCGAARIAYGEAAIANPRAENETHRKAFAELRKEVAKRQPTLAVETGLMALDGTVEMMN
jgi:carbonic anhydrase